MQPNQDPNQFLMGSGIRSARFANLGDVISGRVVDSRISQQTDIVSNEPVSWPNGDPKLQLVVTLQTSLHEDQDDDGMRNVYVKGSQRSGSRSMHAAVADAVRASGATELEKGGTLTVRYESDAPASTPGLNDRKLYGAAFIRPTGSEASGTFLGVTPPQQQPQANGWSQPQQDAPTWAQHQPYQPPAPPQQQPVTVPALDGPSADDLARFNAWKASQGQQV